MFILPHLQLAQPYIRKELGVFVALCKLFSVYFSYCYGILTQLPCQLLTKLNSKVGGRDKQMNPWGLT